MTKKKKMNISLVVAVAENGVIGKDNNLLWKLSADLKRFKNITSNHYILLGRKTFESIEKPLPNRTSLIISRNFECDFENCFVFKTINEAIVFAAEKDQEEIFVIGGGEIYSQTLPLANRIHLTLVHTEIEGDTYFDYDESNWKVKHKQIILKDEKNEFDSTYLILEREKL
jgi:dihydrofolate reductase